MTAICHTGKRFALTVHMVDTDPDGRAICNRVRTWVAIACHTAHHKSAAPGRVAAVGSAPCCKNIHTVSAYPSVGNPSDTVDNTSAAISDVWAVQTRPDDCNDPGCRSAALSSLSFA